MKFMTKESCPVGSIVLIRTVNSVPDRSAMSWPAQTTLEYGPLNKARIVSWSPGGHVELEFGSNRTMWHTPSEWDLREVLALP